MREWRKRHLIRSAPGTDADEDMGALVKGAKPVAAAKLAPKPVAAEKPVVKEPAVKKKEPPKKPEEKPPTPSAEAAPSWKPKGQATAQEVFDFVDNKMRVGSVLHFPDTLGLYKKARGATMEITKIQSRDGKSAVHYKRIGDTSILAPWELAGNLPLEDLKAVSYTHLTLPTTPYV